MFSRVGHAFLGCSVAVGWLFGVAGCGGQAVSLGDPRGLDAGVGGAPSIDATIPDAPLAEASPEDALTVDAADGGWTVPEFGDPELLVELAGGTASDPTLTNGLLEIYFLSDRSPSVDWDVWFASRTLVTDPFGAPQRIAAVSVEGDDKSPAISGDGQILWVAHDTVGDAGLGGYDIYQSTRTGNAWQTPMRVDDLNSGADDAPRPLGNNELTMPVASRRATDVSSHYLTYLVTRTSSTFAGARWQDAYELNGPDPESNTADAFLTPDGMTIYFTRAQNELGDIYVAHRESTGVKFGNLAALSSNINTAADERDPFLAADGYLYFARGPSTSVRVYRARLLTGP